MALPIVGSVIELGKLLVERLIPDKKAQAEALQKLTELEQSGDLAVIASQVEINKLEAANPNLFVSGWRPAVGWVCVAAMAFQLVIGPMAVWVSMFTNHPVPLPVMETELLTTLLIGMLGLGGLRTVEKLQGVAKK